MKLIDYLKKNKITQQQFSKTVNVHKIYINKIINGDRHPGRKLAARIEKATGGKVSRMELLYPEESLKGAEPIGKALDIEPRDLIK